MQHRQACIVFTDGAANDAAKVPAASKAWQEKGVTVFALGIGKGIDGAGKSTGFFPVHLDFHRRQTKMTAEISRTIKHRESFSCPVIGSFDDVYLRAIHFKRVYLIFI